MTDPDVNSRLNARLSGRQGIERELGRSSATNFFSGNGISVAAMCAESHQYRPPADGHGGVSAGGGPLCAGQADMPPLHCLTYDIPTGGEA